MSDSISISDLMTMDEAYQHVIDTFSLKFETQNSQTNLKNIISVLDEIDRFQSPEGLEQWKLEVSQTDDEGIEFMIVHDILDIIVLLIEDDEEYTEEEILELIGIDDIYFPKYQEFLAEKSNVALLMKELRAWEMDSNFHVYAIDHLDNVLKKGYELSPFGGRKDIDVELSFDEEEIFIGCIDEEFDALSATPDYSLPHHLFDPERPDESIELGIQSWSEFAEEDSNWDDSMDDDEDFEADDDDFDADWDSDTDDEWDPGFDDEDD